jgi:hypothetical protein
VSEQIAGFLDVFIRNRAVRLFNQSFILQDQFGLLAKLQEVTLGYLVLLVCPALLHLRNLDLAGHFGSLAASQLLCPCFVKILEFVQDFLLELLLIVVELGAFLNHLLEEDVVSVLAEHALCEFLVLGRDSVGLLALLFLQVLPDDLLVLLPQLLLAIVDLGVVGGAVLREILLLLCVAGFEPLWDSDGVESFEGEFDLAGGGVVLAGRAVVVAVDVVELGEILVGVRMVEWLEGAVFLCL